MFLGINLSVLTVTNAFLTPTVIFLPNTSTIILSNESFKGKVKKCIAKYTNVNVCLPCERIRSFVIAPALALPWTKANIYSNAIAVFLSRISSYFHENTENTFSFCRKSFLSLNEHAKVRVEVILIVFALYCHNDCK